MTDRDLLVAAHTSLCIRWGTTAPYLIGTIHGARVGFAADPFVQVEVLCNYRDIGSLVPIVRQRVYGELAERGWDPSTIEFTPRTQTGRRRKFVDNNEESESFGKNKVAETHEFRFLMLDRALIHATFNGPGPGSYLYRQLPERPAEVT